MLQVEKAFLKIFTDANFFTRDRIEYENDDIDPSKFTGAWCEVKFFGNDVTPLTLNSIDESDGFFQITLHYPTGELSFGAKEKAQEILNAFKIGRRINTQDAKIFVTRKQQLPSSSGASSYDLVLRIFFTVAITRA